MKKKPIPPTARKKSLTRGMPRSFDTPEDLIAAGWAYLQWCLDNPLLVEKTSVHDGEVIRYDTKKIRAPTQAGFSLFAGVSSNFLSNAKAQSKDDYGEAAETVMSMIRTNQLEGGMAGLYHGNLTARIAGVADSMAIAAPPVRPELEIPDMTSVPMLVHPDEDPHNPSGLTFTQAQLEAGVQLPPAFHASPVIEGAPVVVVQEVAAPVAGQPTPWKGKL